MEDLRDLYKPVVIYTAKNATDFDASCGFYRPDAICQQVVSSLLTSSSCIKSVNIRLIQALKIRIKASKIRIQALKIRIQAVKIRIQALKTVRIQALKIRTSADSPQRICKTC